MERDGEEFTLVGALSGPTPLGHGVLLCSVLRRMRNCNQRGSPFGEKVRSVFLCVF